MTKSVLAGFEDLFSFHDSYLLEQVASTVWVFQCGGETDEIVHLIGSIAKAALPELWRDEHMRAALLIDTFRAARIDVSVQLDLNHIKDCDPDWRLESKLEKERERQTVAICMESVNRSIQKWVELEKYHASRDGSDNTVFYSAPHVETHCA